MFQFASSNRIYAFALVALLGAVWVQSSHALAGGVRGLPSSRGLHLLPPRNIALGPREHDTLQEADPKSSVMSRRLSTPTNAPTAAPVPPANLFFSQISFLPGDDGIGTDQEWDRYFEIYNGDTEPVSLD